MFRATSVFIGNVCSLKWIADVVEEKKRVSNLILSCIAFNPHRCRLSLRQGILLGFSDETRRLSANFNVQLYTYLAYRYLCKWGKLSENIMALHCRSSHWNTIYGTLCSMRCKIIEKNSLHNRYIIEERWWFFSFLFLGKICILRTRYY